MKTVGPSAIAEKHGLVRRIRGAIAALAFGAILLASSRPVSAIDRTLGADVPKPSASGAPWADADIASLDANIDVALAGATTLHGAHVGLVAIDARDGHVLYQHNGDDLFEPASTLKLVVGSLALERLGPSFRFHTDAVSTAPIVGGILNGKLIVRTGGDPFLSQTDFEKLADTIVAQGITRITGGIAFDVSRYERAQFPPGWLIEDEPYGYAAPVGALAFEQNSVHVIVAPGAVVDGPATMKLSPNASRMVPIEGCTQTAETFVFLAAKTGPSTVPDSIDLYRERDGCTIVTGTIGFGADADTLEAAVRFPTVYAERQLREAIRRRGVNVAQEAAVSGPLPLYDDGAAPAGSTVLWMHDSEPLSDVVGDTWMPSDNLAAEMLLRELSFANATVPGTTADGIRVEQAWLKNLGVDTGSLALSDGSGLSSYDRITPRALIAVLQHDWNGPLHDLVLDDLPIAGVRGTLQHSYVGTALDRHVFAKTGTVSRANGLAGYLATGKHGAVIFAFMIDESVADAAALRDLRARVLSHFLE